MDGLEKEEVSTFWAVFGACRMWLENFCAEFRKGLHKP